jgi:hypothetical protein
LTKGKRIDAIDNGAIPLRREESVRLFQDARAAVMVKRRAFAQEPKPETKSEDAEAKA